MREVADLPGLLATSLSWDPDQVQARSGLPTDCFWSAADGGWRAELGVLPVLYGTGIEKTKSGAFREFRLLCALGLIRWEETRSPYTSPGTWEFQKALRALSMAHRVHELSLSAFWNSPEVPELGVYELRVSSHLITQGCGAGR